MRHSLKEPLWRETACISPREQVQAPLWTVPCGKPAQDSQTFPAGVTEAGILSLKAVTTAKTKLKLAGILRI